MKSVLRITVCTLFFMGAFFIGAAVWQIGDECRLIWEYQESQVVWKQELAEGRALKEVWDIRNQTLAEAMKHTTIEQEVYVKDNTGYAGISVSPESPLGCMVTLLRSATGERLYESGFIEPGHYIEEILLEEKLPKGYYPCTVVWSFYTKEEEYVGETASVTVVVVKN